MQRVEIPQASSSRYSHELVSTTYGHDRGTARRAARSPLPAVERGAQAEAGPGTYVRGIAMAGAEEFLSSKQQQKQVPAGIFLQAVISLESFQEQNLSRVGSFLLLLIYVSIFYMKSQNYPTLSP